MTSDDQNLKYIIALTLIKALKPSELKLIFKNYDCLNEVFEKSQLRLPEISKESSHSIAKFNKWDNVDQQLELLDKEKISIITILDELNYPPQLRNIDDPPVLLFKKGINMDHTKPMVSIVGTRRPTSYGKAMTEKIACELAENSVTIVSGMARGCDSAAHKGALKASSGTTIAVLGSGIDVCYPKDNAKLYDEIIERGTLLSEFPIGTPPLKFNFPQRNRIVSGMSSALIITEAPYKSGAMMTARFATEQGREVFAMPGTIVNENAQGPHKLIKDGAQLIESAKDVLEIFNMSLNIEFEKPSQASLSIEQQNIIDTLSTEPLHIDSLADKCNLKVWKLSTILLEMELKGIVEKQPGNIYSKLY